MNAYRTIAPASVLTLTLLAGLAAPATAQETTPLAAGDIEIGFDIGAIRFDDAIANNSDDEEVRQGIRFGWLATDAFEVEVQASRANAVLESTLDTVLVNGVFNFYPSGTPNVVPYLLVGVGGARLETGGLFTEDVAEEGLDYQAAIGSRIYFGGSRMALRLELGTLFDDTLDETGQHTSLSAGLTWRIGR